MERRLLVSSAGGHARCGDAGLLRIAARLHGFSSALRHIAANDTRLAPFLRIAVLAPHSARIPRFLRLDPPGRKRAYGKRDGPNFTHARPDTGGRRLHERINALILTMKKNLIRVFLTMALCALSAMAAGCAVPESSPAEATAQIGPAQQPADAPAQPVASPLSEQSPPETPHALPAPYTALIAQYAEALRIAGDETLDTESKNAAYGADVAFEWRANPQPVYYALWDADGNGSDELLIAALTEGNPSYYDVFTLDNGRAARLFDLDFGYRTNLDVYGDGAFKVTWSNSAFESGVDYYRLNGAAVEALAAFVITSSAEDPNTMVYLHDGVEVTEAAYETLLLEYDAAGAPSLTWVDMAKAG